MLRVELKVGIMNEFYNAKAAKGRVCSTTLFVLFFAQFFQMLLLSIVLPRLLVLIKLFTYQSRQFSLSFSNRFWSSQSFSIFLKLATIILNPNLENPLLAFPFFVIFLISCISNSYLSGWFFLVSLSVIDSSSVLFSCQAGFRVLFLQIDSCRPPKISNAAGYLFHFLIQ